MEQLLELMQYANKKIKMHDNEDIDGAENDWDDGAKHGAAEGRIAAYKDIIKYAAARIEKAL